MTTGLLLSASPARADINDLIERATSRATQARDKATEAKQAVDDVRSRIAAGASMLTDDIRAKITEAMAVVRERIAVEQAGMREFTPERVEALRQELLRLLNNVRALEDRVNAITGDCGLGAPLQNQALDALITLVENAPASVLYPLYAARIDFCGVEDLDVTVDALPLVQDVLASDSADEAGEDAASDEADPFAVDRELFASRLASSRVYIEHRKALSRAASQIKRNVWALKKIADLVKNQGDSGTEATVGVHGYALITVKFNKAKEIANVLNAVAGKLDSIEKDLSGKMKSAESISTANLILMNQEAILRNLEAQAAGR